MQASEDKDYQAIMRRPAMDLRKVLREIHEIPKTNEMPSKSTCFPYLEIYSENQPKKQRKTTAKKGHMGELLLKLQGSVRGKDKAHFHNYTLRHMNETFTPQVFKSVPSPKRGSSKKETVKSFEFNLKLNGKIVVSRDSISQSPKNQFRKTLAGKHKFQASPIYIPSPLREPSENRRISRRSKVPKIDVSISTNN